MLLVLGAVLSLLLESSTAFDRFFQDPFYRDGTWLLSEQFHARYKALLYTTPKIGIGLTGGAFLLLFAYASEGSVPRLPAWKKPALLVVLSLALIPLLVSGLKAVSGVYGPVDLLPYGGKQQHIGLLRQLWMYGHIAGGRNFPAGHASGGFALVALAYLPLSRFARKALFGAGLGAGWLMGLYQTARGEHFMSHTLTTMFIALAAVTLLAQGLKLPPTERPRS